MFNWLVRLYTFSALSQTKHMGLLGAGSRCDRTTFWECMRVYGCVSVRVSAESCAEVRRHRWRFERCHRRVLRNRGPAEKWPAYVCFPVWTYCTFLLPRAPAGFSLCCRSSWRNSTYCGWTHGASRDNTHRPRVWFQGLVDMNTPSSSGWPSVTWILSVFGHWNWLLSVTRSSPELPETRSRLACHFGHIFLQWIRGFARPPWMFNMLVWVR